MTIRKGEPWGSAALAADRVVACVDSDQLLASIHLAHTQAHVTGGALWDVLGRPGPVHAGDSVMVLPIDAMEVTVDGVTMSALDHVVVRRLWRRGGACFGRVVIVTNLGRWHGREVAPRSHPNDGRLDVVSVAASMPLRQRLAAWKKARVGDHLPHGQIDASSARTIEMMLEGGEVVVIDGRAMRCSSLTVQVLPDYLSVVVPAPTVVT